MKFTKMQGIGNDYIYVNCYDQIVESPSQTAINLSKRHYSVGADGLVLICRSDVADAKMRMFNADGSEGKMCGNAIRCVGKYLYDNKIISKTEVSIETKSG
ncbi:MAG: diaminopimelate epimerase, partial [Clostridia bacterium]